MIAKNLIDRFSFLKPVILKKHTRSRFDAVCFPDRTVIYANDQSYQQNSAIMLSMAKLVENDPLLATFFIEPLRKPYDVLYCDMFSRLCMPLRDAWTMKTMRKNTPDLYQKEIQKVFYFQKYLEDYGFNSIVSELVSDHSRFPFIGFVVLSYYLSAYENTENSDIVVDGNIDFPAGHDNPGLWGNYIASLKRFSRMEPDIMHYLNLVQSVNAPYEVGVDRTERPCCYVVQEKTTGREWKQ